MAYNPTVWEENDLLSADRMNKIEQGIAEASETPDGLLPAGGTAGQMLVKTSDEDFDVEWAEAASGGSMLTIENETINTPEKFLEYFDLEKLSCFAHFKNTTMLGVFFDNQIVYVERKTEEDDEESHIVFVYTQEGNRYKYGYYDGWETDNFDYVAKSEVTWDGITSEDVNFYINNSVFAKVDNFSKIYGLDIADGESKTVKFTGSFGTITGAKIKSSDTVSDVLSSNALFNYKNLYYDKKTGAICEYKKGEKPSAVTVSIGDTTYTPTPVPASFATSFNGRNGAVVPQSGDYTAEMVGAIANTTVSEIAILTQAEYDALTTKDATTLYLVKEEA